MTPALLYDVVAPDSHVGRLLLRAYFDELASRWRGRPVTGPELDAVLREHTSDDLAPPHGLLLAARCGNTLVGCAGLRLLPDAVGEVARVYVYPAQRGRGVGGGLMKELERQAVAHDRRMLRLDTRGDLVEARRLYARLGYVEVPPFNTGPFADHWFAKPLTET